MPAPEQACGNVRTGLDVVGKRKRSIHVNRLQTAADHPSKVGVRVAVLHAVAMDRPGHPRASTEAGHCAWPRDNDCMTGLHRYRLPDGAEVESHDGSTVTFRVTMPADDAGHIGRRCPSCHQMFRMHASDFAALPEDQRLTCPYCGFSAGHAEFITPQQMNRARAAVGDWAHQMAADKIGQALDGMVRNINRSASSSGIIRFSASRGTSRPDMPATLPAITEPAPIRERQCLRCKNRYAIFGQHIACPVCGPLAPKVVADDVLAAQTAILDALGQLPAEHLDQLRELGAVEQTASSTLGAVVASLETYLRGTFTDSDTGADQLTAGLGTVFQRLDDVAGLYRDHLGIELPKALAADWERLRVLYGLRHLLTHKNGVVDDRHLKRFPGFPVALGQRVTVSLVDARDAIRCGKRVLDAT